VIWDQVFWRAHNFQHADPEFRETAVVDLLAKRKKLDAILKQIKEVQGEYGEENLPQMWQKLIQCS